jgi:hypothetical protein
LETNALRGNISTNTEMKGAFCRSDPMVYKSQKPRPARQSRKAQNESRRSEFRESTVESDRLCQEGLVKTEDFTCSAVTVIFRVCNLVRLLVTALKSVTRTRIVKTLLRAVTKTSESTSRRFKVE